MAVIPLGPTGLIPLGTTVTLNRHGKDITGSRAMSPEELNAQRTVTGHRHNKYHELSGLPGFLYYSNELEPVTPYKVEDWSID